MYKVNNVTFPITVNELYTLMDKSHSICFVLTITWTYPTRRVAEQKKLCSVSSIFTKLKDSTKTKKIAFVSSAINSRQKKNKMQKTLNKDETV